MSQLEYILKDVPHRYKDKCLIVKRLLCDKVVTTFLLTKTFDFLEINKKEIVNFVKLDNPSAKEDDPVIFRVFERLDSVLIFLIHSRENLFVISRKNSNLTYRIIPNVQEMKVLGQNLTQSEALVVLKMTNGTEDRTSFYEEHDKPIQADLSSAIQSNLKHQKTCMTKILEDLSLRQQLKLYSLIGSQKFLPRPMRLDDPNDISPLVKFGSVFSRVCNDKLVVGIPVFNSSSLERRLLCEDLKLIMYCSSLTNAAINYDLYKMRTDCPSFEEFEGLFKEQCESEDGDMKMPERPDIKAEWRRCYEKSHLFACETGVFVMTADISQFLSDVRHPIEFCVTYDIQGTAMTTAKQITNVGRLVIDSKLIYSTEIHIAKFGLEKYRNLLAITSTAPFAVTLDLLVAKDERVEQFLVHSLSFEIIKSREDAGHEHPTSYYENASTKAVSLRLRKDYFLYSSDGYFKGTLLRVRLESDDLMKTKIYGRTSHQVVILIQAIHRQYPQSCKIKLVEII